jgi:hypothetical protein
MGASEDKLGAQRGANTPKPYFYVMSAAMLDANQGQDNRQNIRWALPATKEGPHQIFSKPA